VAAQLLSTMGWKLTASKVMKALSQIKKNNGLMGRWECIQDRPRVILDVAHNEHGVHALLEQLASLQYHQLHIVTGMVKDKDVQSVLKLLPKNALYYFTQSHIPRALPVNELAAQAAVIGLNGLAYEDVNLALKDAIKNANHHDLILVIGSVFLVAEVDRTKFL
jgi:dihydrofolate synthase/folylpolyglutamate synthase